MMAFHLQPLQATNTLPTTPTSNLVNNSNVGVVETNQEEFECAQCEYKTFRKSNLTQHVRTVHDRVKNFSCNRCDYSSARRSNVNYHIKTVHDNIKDYACQYCNFKSARKYNVIQHSERVHKNETLAGEQKFIQQKQLIQDNNTIMEITEPLKNVRKPRKKVVPLRSPTLVGGSPTSSVQTISIQPQQTPSGFTLDPPTMVNQGSNFAAMTLNYAHHQPMYNSPPTIPSSNSNQTQIQLPTSPVNNFSPLPAMNFSSLQPIQYNQLNQPPFNGSSRNLIGNVKKETKTKEFACTFCPFKASKKKNLSSHLQTVHQANPVPNYATLTSVDNEVVLSSISLGNTNLKKTNLVSDKPKNFSCTYCGFRTAYKRNVKAHINEVHLKERREHKCDSCEFKSTRKSNLAQHIKSVHQRIKDHRCSTCGFTSTRKRNVEKHVMSMHVQKNQLISLKPDGI